jgi:outer membrane biogenesis lipoprotein LolB
MKNTVITIVIILLCGCSTTTKQSALSQDVAKAVTLVETKDTRQDAENIEKALKETLEFCAPILQGFED